MAENILWYNLQGEFPHLAFERFWQVGQNEISLPGQLQRLPWACRDTMVQSQIKGILGNFETYGYTDAFQGDYSELVYLRARQYSPRLGRFLTRDTWVGNPHSPLSLNKYIYTKGNPIDSTDPSGLCAESGWQDADGGLFTKANCDQLETDLKEGTTEFTDSWYHQLADRMRADGLTQTADAMDYYLQGAGGERRLSSDFIQNTIEVGMPEIHNQINDLVNWYVQKNFASLANCSWSDIGPDIYAKGYTADYLGIALGRRDEQREVAGTFGSFRIDVELSGRLDRKPFLWFYNTDSKISVHVVMLDVYNWNKGASVDYPPYLFRGNTILDNWAANLEKHGSARSYINRGDYIYQNTQKDIGGPGWFFNANKPPSDWILASCVGSQFDIDQEGPGTVDYCGNPMR